MVQPWHRSKSSPLFKTTCHCGICDLCYKWPCIFHRFSVAASIRDVLAHAVSRLGSDGKQRHLVYMKRASTFIPPSAAARPDPWLQPRRDIFLPMGDGLHGMELKAQHQDHQALSDGHTFMVVINSLGWDLWREGQVERLRLLRASKPKLHRLRKELCSLLQSGTV